MSAIAFSPPIAGRLWSEIDNEDFSNVSIIGLDTDSGSAIIVDTDAIVHLVPMKQVDFVGVAPKG